MKRYVALLTVLLCIFSAEAQQMTIASLQGQNVDSVLLQHLAGDGVEISGGRFNNNTGNISASTIGVFTSNNTTFPFHFGIYMVTGGSNSTYSDGTNNFTAKNLQNMGYNITHGSALDFYFLAYADTFSFNYVFASAEYDGYTCSSFNDVFAFILEGIDPVTYVETAKNVAIIPTTITAANPAGLPVSINTLNSGQCSGSNSLPPGGSLAYSAYFTKNYNNSYPSSLGGFNGSTVALSASSKILACQSYKMHLAISNVSDHALDSGVFLEEGSFYSPTLDISNEYNNSTASGDTLIQNCRECDLTFRLPIAPSSSNLSVEVNVAGNATLGQDFSLFLPDGTPFDNDHNSFPFEEGDTIKQLHMAILPEAQFTDPKNISVLFKTERCPGNDNSVLFDTLHFVLIPNDTIKLKKEDNVFGACDLVSHVEVELLRGTPELNYKWIPATGLEDPTSLSTNAAISQTTTYKVVASDRWNCLSDTAEVQVNIVPKPDFTVSFTPDHGCMPLAITTQVQYTPDFATVKWEISNEEEEDVQEFEESLVHATLENPGWYDIKIVVESAPGCSDSTTFANAVHVSDFPTANFTFTPEEPDNGEIISFTNTSEGENITNYVWNFGDGHSSYEENPTHAYHLRESDIMTVKLTVTNADGCSNDIFYTIPVQDNFALFVPSGFTPNTDGLNEIFLPKAKDVTNYELIIFSRNGEIIFYTTNPDEGWDGTIKGKPAPQGVYPYTIHYARIGTPQEILVKNGAVTLIR